MPGICGVQSIAAHPLHLVPEYSHSHRPYQRNLFYEECNEIARLIGFKFKIDFLLNFRGEVIKIFCGDVIEEHSEAIKDCARKHYRGGAEKSGCHDLRGYPLERGNQSIKSLGTAAAVTKSGGQIIWVAPQPIGSTHSVCHEVSSNKSTMNITHTCRREVSRSSQAYWPEFYVYRGGFKNLLDRFRGSFTSRKVWIDPMWSQ